MIKYCLDCWNKNQQSLREQLEKDASLNSCEYEYLMTYVGYGSCSGCDTLQAIQECGENIPTPEQLKDFMSLCKDLVTNMIKPYNTGWRATSDFEPVVMEE